MLCPHSYSSRFGEVAHEWLIISTNHSAVCVDAHGVVVGNTYKVERPIIEERTLNAATAGIYSYTQENNIRGHMHAFRRKVAGHRSRFNSACGLHGVP